jgi:plasmid maintenance system antidote protein VapI
VKAEILARLPASFVDLVDDNPEALDAVCRLLADGEIAVVGGVAHTTPGPHAWALVELDVEDLEADDGSHDDQPFVPNWASPPGETLRDLMEERGWDAGWVAWHLVIPTNELPRLFDGSRAIDDAMAARLAGLTGSPATFWLKREKQYRDDLARITSTPAPPAELRLVEDDGDAD